MAMKIGLTEARIQVRKENRHLYYIQRSYELIPQSCWFLRDIANVKSNILY